MAYNEKRRQFGAAVACPISMREQDSRDQPYRQGAQANHRHCKPTIPHGRKIVEGLLTHRDHLSHEPCNPDTVLLRTPGVQYPIISVPGYGMHQLQAVRKTQGRRQSLYIKL